MEINTAEFVRNPCPECGDERGTGRSGCTICSRDRLREKNRETIAARNNPKPEATIPKESSRKLKFGPGSDSWEASKAEYTKH